jgi:hypothetical protein
MSEFFASVVAGVFLGAVFLGLSTIAISPGPTWEDVRQATVKIATTEYGDFCSGTFLDENTIITAFHCTEIFSDGQVYIIKMNDGSILNAKIASKSSVYDTAALDLIEGSSKHYVDFAESGSLELGQEIWGAGYPDIDTLDEFRLHPCIIADNTGKHVYWAIESTATYLQSGPGMSGGGLYAKVNGKIVLVGTLQGAYTRLPAISYWSTIEGVNAVVAYE